ncbi:MAG: hypothetical protein A2487_11310 [Candidatus Raymondbacteria bacterium RifOxyC12_full_50_8]|uniref:Uncharacterized protein n=1 Tax=Candidatus Raymondbacteria bacterium RIFOXYD12_FULL_49_13 TaxID=1817890 RepID=A0A1F7FL76_UNCRA|nr:MAG: hypothetical protein A2248_11180 [Candidatus Raymondbacteria bacterium RIFOXYA2_FULL_49_16]OGJ95372.1 MAG: hypothetical protein A2453_09310 [Candidatus Raymondbacteria bacterium RIFOXYC2_FULL_50_21]OGJ98495.1 MAG: hypothetical protein A2350_10690 [Candidatus Raymondbacteria bacterium RifOxyB12_full_50_8]OGK03163.1 MAG: hypothetical protein A2487_11310 [Candidatus Raymondbacteria bacterium RifOxyC12_full_50_8]OGK07388.1 MAG: hypothetical protein A2519_21210 [Candidatus Raymondbacteria ba
MKKNNHTINQLDTLLEEYKTIFEVTSQATDKNAYLKNQKTLEELGEKIKTMQFNARLGLKPGLL